MCGTVGDPSEFKKNSQADCIPIAAMMCGHKVNICGRQIPFLVTGSLFQLASLSLIKIESGDLA